MALTHNLQQSDKSKCKGPEKFMPYSIEREPTPEEIAAKARQHLAKLQAKRGK